MAAVAGVMVEAGVVAVTAVQVLALKVLLFLHTQ